jgi:IclR family KDG regulon transcriptional repressor
MAEQQQVSSKTKSPVRKSPQKDPADYNVRAVERALQIMVCFDEEHQELTLSEISHLVDLHKATTHRIVTTLVNFGFLERADDGQRYRLGLRLAGLGFNVIRRMDLRREALPYMNQIVMKWEEACDLSIYDNEHVFYIEVLRGNYALSIAAAVGQRLPAYCTASGKLFLAHLPESETEKIVAHPLKSYTRNTITSPSVLRAHFEKIRQRGYSTDDEEFEVGIRAIAAPIFNQEGKIVAALGMPSPSSRMTLDRTEIIARALMDATRAISHRMGWQM